MAQTPDRNPGPLREEEILLDVNPGVPTQPGAIRFDGSAIRMRDVLGDFDPRSAGTPDLSKHVLDVQGGFVYTSDGDFVLKV